MKKPRKPSKSAQRQAALGVTTRVLRIRIKDKHAGHLLAQSREVNFVWNFCNETGVKVFERERRFVSAYDLAPLTKGAGKAGLSLHSQTVQGIAEEFVKSRAQHKKVKLRWRVSRGSRRSLGWIPVKASALAYRNGQVHYQGMALSLWDSYGLAGYTLRAGSFSEDARGRWFLNVSVDVPKAARPLAMAAPDAVALDLGLKELYTLSDGTKVTAPQIYRGLEEKLAVSQRARKKNRTRAIHAKIANCRKDFLHKHSTDLVRRHQAIFVGNVNAQALAKTGMAKSVLDAGWSAFRTMLKYKSDDAGAWFADIEESFSTQECHVCGERCGPKGLAGLSVRSWTCACGAVHDRDTNSALVIKKRGLAWLEEQFAAAADMAKASDAVVSEDSGALCAMAEAGHGLPVVGIPFLSAQAAAARPR